MFEEFYAELLALRGTPSRYLHRMWMDSWRRCCEQTWTHFLRARQYPFLMGQMVLDFRSRAHLDRKCNNSSEYGLVTSLLPGICKDQFTYDRILLMHDKANTDPWPDRRPTSMSHASFIGSKSFRSNYSWLFYLFRQDWSRPCNLKQRSVLHWRQRPYSSH